MSKKVPKKVKEILNTDRKRVDYTKHKSFSFSQLSTFLTCPHRWYLDKVERLQEYEPSIHTVFGTAMHETIQQWLDTLYSSTVKKAQEMDLDDLLLERMKKNYKKERYKIGYKDFSDSKQMQEFYDQGVQILEFLKKKRSDYFFKKKTYLAGIETPLMEEVRPGIFFTGFIDLVFYDEVLDRYTLVDIKTSTRGWNKYQKRDEIKQSQLILYKHFFCKKYNIPPDNVDIQFFIVKRIIPQDTDWPVKRVQLFEPASGKIKTGKILKQVNEFLDQAFTYDGEYVKSGYKKNPSKNNCRFCPYLEQLSLCDSGIK